MTYYCSLANSVTLGASDSNYQIEPSGLLRANNNCLLYQKSLRRGVRYQVEDVLIPDSKERPRRSYSQSFIEKLKWIHQRNVVLWDAGDRRGWLINGTSALLHAVLASLECDQNDPFASASRFRKEQLRRPEEHNENSAARILGDEFNLGLNISTHGEETASLKDRIEDIYFLMQLMIEYQILASEKINSLLGYLEGWEFMDLANSAQDPLYPRVFLPDKDCIGWMNLLKETCAITLFGRDFGDIIEPANRGPCTYWASLPSGNCYLAAGVNELEKIMKTHGDRYATPRRLTFNTIWHSLSSTFENCRCGEHAQEHADLVQILVPSFQFRTP